MSSVNLNVHHVWKGSIYSFFVAMLCSFLFLFPPSTDILMGLFSSGLDSEVLACILNLLKDVRLTSYGDYRVCLNVSVLSLSFTLFSDPISFSVQLLSNDSSVVWYCVYCL